MVKVPKQVILEVTSRCNLQCKYCPNVCNASFPTGDMPVALFKSLADKIKREMPEAVVIPWMNGEPFLHPQYLEMVRYLSELGLRFYVTTNLTIWREDIIRFLLSEKSTCYQLIISMDGVPGSDSISIARPGTDKKLLVQNVNKLIRIKREMESDKQLAVKICERGQDWQEIEEYVQEWLYEDDGVDYVCVGKPLKDENEVSMRRHPCQYFDNNFMVIRWNGELVPCAYNDKVANQGMLTYGSVDEETGSLLQKYNNGMICAMREDQNEGRYPEPCDKCSFAYTGFGFQGAVEFRHGILAGTKLYYHQDYYNMFFSKKKNWKPVEYYRRG